MCVRTGSRAKLSQSSQGHSLLYPFPCHPLHKSSLDQGGAFAKVIRGKKGQLSQQFSSQQSESQPTVSQKANLSAGLSAL